tara:strand:- start:1575 stop:2516 length:942 start_codon:yes stop_codon:yes gene_type:complete
MALASSAIANAYTYQSETNASLTDRTMNIEKTQTVRGEVKTNLSNYYQNNESEAIIEESKNDSVTTTDKQRVSSKNCVMLSPTQKECDNTYLEMSISKSTSGELMNDMEISTNEYTIKEIEDVTINSSITPPTPITVFDTVPPVPPVTPTNELRIGTRGDYENSPSGRGWVDTVFSDPTNFNGTITINIQYEDEAKIRSNLNIFPVYACAKLGQPMKVVDRSGNEIASVPVVANYGYQGAISNTGMNIDMKLREQFPLSANSLTKIWDGSANLGRVMITGTASTLSIPDHNTFEAQAANIANDPELWDTICPE